MARTLGIAAIVLGTSLLLSFGPASAQDSPATLCNGGEGITLTARIQGCTAFIASGADTPELTSAYINLGNSHDDNGQPDLAIDDYAHAIALSPDQPKIYFNRGVVYYNKGDYSRAIQDLDQAIRLKPDYVRAYTARGQAKKFSGDIAGGEADIATARSLTP